MIHLTRYAYDGAGRVSEVRLPTSSGSDNRYLLYRWTHDGLLRSVNAPSPETAGARVDAATYRYDGSGRMVSQTDALGHATSYAYYADGLLAEVQGEPGDETHLTSFGYDANGNRVRATDPVGHVSRLTWHTDDLVSSVEDGAGNKTRYRYTQDGHPEQIFSPAANVSGPADNNTADPTVNTFTPDGLLETSTVPVASDGSLRRRTSYTYDLAGRKIAQRQDEVDHTGALVRQGRAQSFTYYPSGRLRSETGHGTTERTKTYSYDAAGNLTELVEQRFTGGYRAAKPEPHHRHLVAGRPGAKRERDAGLGNKRLRIRRGRHARRARRHPVRDLRAHPQPLQLLGRRPSRDHDRRGVGHHVSRVKKSGHFLP